MNLNTKIKKRKITVSFSIKVDGAVLLKQNTSVATKLQNLDYQIWIPQYLKFLRTLTPFLQTSKKYIKLHIFRVYIAERYKRTSITSTRPWTPAPTHVL